MRKRSFYYIRTFKCLDCGNKLYASKLKKFTKNGHLKDMYCPWCKKTKTMKQIDYVKCN